MKKYQYSPLTRIRQIRLLKLHAGAEVDELSGELVHISLDETPSFTALSYAWATCSPEKKFAARASESRSVPACTAPCSISDSPLVRPSSGRMRFASTKI